MSLSIVQTRISIGYCGLSDVQNCHHIKFSRAPFRSLDLCHSYNKAFSRDVTAAMLVCLNKEMKAVMMYQTNPPGIELYFYANTFFCFKSNMVPGHVSENSPSTLFVSFSLICLFTSDLN